MPPAPARLVKRIQDGEFIDMAELTIDKLNMPCPDEATIRQTTPKYDQ